MHHSILTRQRLAAIFLMGLLLLYSPAMTLFDRASEWGGVPISYLYLFGVWLLLVVLAASASYIAVPAAMRLALPEASPSIYLGMSLAITFPFNLLFGIPLYHYVLRTLYF